MHEEKLSLNQVIKNLREELHAATGNKFDEMFNYVDTMGQGIMISVEKIVGILGNRNTHDKPGKRWLNPWSSNLAKLGFNLTLFVSDSTLGCLKSCPALRDYQDMEENDLVTTRRVSAGNFCDFIAKVKEQENSRDTRAFFFIEHLSGRLAGDDLIDKAQMVTLSQQAKRLVDLSNSKFAGSVIISLLADESNREFALKAEETLGNTEGINTISMNSSAGMSHISNRGAVQSLGEAVKNIPTSAGEFLSATCGTCGVFCSSPCLLASELNISSEESEESVSIADDAVSGRGSALALQKFKLKSDSVLKPWKSVESSGREDNFKSWKSGESSGREDTRTCWVCGSPVADHTPPTPCSSNGLANCSLCGRRSHLLAAHRVRSHRAREAMKSRWGPDFRFVTSREIPHQKKRKFHEV